MRFWQIKKFVGSIPWLGSRLRGIYSRWMMARELRRIGPEYSRWMRDRVRVRRDLYPAPASQPPGFDILTLTYNTDPHVLRQTAGSVLKQDYSQWRWVIWDNGSTNPETLRVLEELACDPRVYVHRSSENLRITGGHEAALQLCDREYVVLLDHDDLLDGDALRIVAWHIDVTGRPGFLYSDEDKCACDGRRFRPLFKPGPSAALLHDTAYTCHLSVARLDLLLASRAFSDRSVEGTQDWDMTLRLLECGARFVHIPEVLYSWRGVPTSAALRGIAAKPYVIQGQRNCLQDVLRRRGLDQRFEVRANPHFRQAEGHWRLYRHAVGSAPAVDVCLSVDRWDQQLVTSVLQLLRKTTYPNWRLRMIWDGTPESLQLLQGELQTKCSIGEYRQLAFEQASKTGSTISCDETSSTPSSESATLIAFWPAGAVPLQKSWIWEAVGQFELLPDTAAVGGRCVDSHQRILGGPAVVDSDARLQVAYHGGLLSDPGYNLFNFCHHEVSEFVDAPVVVRREALAMLNHSEIRSLWACPEAIGKQLRRAGWELTYSPYICAILRSGTLLRRQGQGRSPSFGRVNGKAVGGISATDPFFRFEFDLDTSRIFRPGVGWPAPANDNRDLPFIEEFSGPPLGRGFGTAEGDQRSLDTPALRVA